VADQKNHSKLTDYYSDPWVRRRIREYCGETASPPTCVYLSALDGDHETWDRAPRVPVEALENLLAEGADVARSMWDRSNMLIHLDLDYQNIDLRDEPYRHPAEMFTKLEPIYRATISVLHRLGLPLLPIITGRGYHFTGRVPLDSAVTRRLASIAPETPSWFSTLSERCPSWAPAGLAVNVCRSTCRMPAIRSTRATCASPTARIRSTARCCARLVPVASCRWPPYRGATNRCRR